MNKLLYGIVLLTALTTGVLAKYDLFPRMGVGDVEAPEAGTIFAVQSTTGTSIPCPKMTEVERDALSSIPTGSCVYNTTSQSSQFYNGSVWLNAGSGAVLTEWQTGVDYGVGNFVYTTPDYKLYVANTAHTSSGTFATDIANWDEVSPGVQPIGSSTDNAVVRWDGTDGDTFQDSNILVDDSDNVTGIADLTVTGDTTLDTSLTGVGVLNSGVVSVDADVDQTELGYLDGVTSSVQTQLDGKLEDIVSSTDNGVVRWDGTAGELVQDSGVTIDDSDNLVVPGNFTAANATITGATTLQTSLNGPLKATSGVVSASNIDLTSEVTGTLPIASGGTNSSTALNNNFVMISSGGAIVEDSAVSTTELSYLDGVTSAIQNQLDGKVDEVVSTDNAVTRFDGTTGSVQNSGVIIDDSNNVSGVGTLTTTGLGTLGGGLDSNDVSTIDATGATSALTVNHNGSADAVTISQAGAGEALNVSGGEITTDSNISMTGTGALSLPDGTTAQRPTPTTGMVRFNTDEGCQEVYDGAEWLCVGTGGGGGSAGINFVSDDSFESETLNPDTNSATETYQTFTTDAQLYSESNTKYFRAAYTGLSAADTYVRDSFARTGLDDKQGFFSIWVKANADDFQLCLRTDDASFAAACDSALTTPIVGDDTWRKYEIPFVYGASTVEYEIFNESYTGDVTIEVDKIYVGTTPDGYIKDVAVTTPWVEYTPSYTNFSIGNGTQKVLWRRVGDEIQIRGYIEFGSTTSITGDLIATIPTGLEMDSSKIGDRHYLGNAGLLDSGTDYFDGHTRIRTTLASSNNDFHVRGWYSSNGDVIFSATNPFTWATGDAINFNVSAPIQGWSATSGAIVAQGNNALPVRVIASGNSGGNYNDTTNTEFTEVEDTTSSWNGTQFTAPETGTYSVSGGILLTTSQTVGVQVYIDGSDQYRIGRLNAAQDGQFSGEVFLNEGEVLSLRSNSSSTYTLLNSSNHHLKITKIPDTGTIVGKFANINSSELVNARYTSDAGTHSVTTTAAAIPYEDQVFDNYSIYNTSTGAITFPRSGKYLIIASYGTNPTMTTTQNITIQLRKGTSTTIERDIVYGNTNNVVYQPRLQAVVEVDVSDEDTYYIYSGSSATTTNLVSQSFTNTLSIQELPDTESIIKNFADQSTLECQTKYLDGDITSDSDPDEADLTFNNLEVGKKYQISARVLFFPVLAGDVSATVNIFNGSFPVLRPYGGNGGSSDKNESSSETNTFTATATTVTFDASSIATGTIIAGDGVDETYVRLCQLRSNTILNSNKWN